MGGVGKHNDQPPHRLVWNRALWKRAEADRSCRPLLTALTGQILLVGEVKSNVQGKRVNLQLLAEVRILQQRQQRKAILGLLVDPKCITLYLAEETRGRFGTKYLLKRVPVTTFTSVMAMIVAVMGYIVLFSGKVVLPPVVKEKAVVKEREDEMEGRLERMLERRLEEQREALEKQF